MARTAGQRPKMVQVKMSWEAYQRLDAYRSKQLPKLGKKPKIQDLVSEAVDDYLKGKRGA